MSIPPVPPVDSVIPSDSIAWPEDLLPPPLPRRYQPFPQPARLAPAEVDPFRLADPNPGRDCIDDYVMRVMTPSVPDRMVLLSDRFLAALRDAWSHLDAHIAEQAGDPDRAETKAARRAHAVLSEEIALREWVASCRALLQAA
jgi:hypothetical protein